MCSGTHVTFTATVTGGTTSYTYQWLVNGSPVGTGSTYAYAPANGDSIRCVLSVAGLCAIPGSNTIHMVVNPLLPPSVSITPLHDTICTGDTVELRAVPADAISPTYLWSVNGVNVATGPWYVFTPSGSDTITVTMTSYYACDSTYTTASYTLVLYTYSTSNSVSITVTGHTTAGSLDTFTATAFGGGVSPSYQWYINSSPVAGATSYRYITDTLRSGQVVSCEETSSIRCAVPATATSNHITVDVTTGTTPFPLLKTGGVTVYPNPANDVMHIDNVSAGARYRILSIVGSVMQGGILYERYNNISIQLLPPGVYMLEVMNGVGERVVRKIVKE